jgi:D-tyrosyl-tRNA(Tyr) deacylase
MRLLLQRVSRAEVRIDGRPVGSIGPGLAILIGVGPHDDEALAERLAQRVAALRIFEDGVGQTNRSIQDDGGSALVVSQFTLYADTRRGRRPGFGGAADPALAERLYGRFVEALRGLGIPVATGAFGARMELELVNRGPFTIWLDSEDGR